VSQTNAQPRLGLRPADKADINLTENKFYFQQMKQSYAQEWPQFFTATIQEWKHLLGQDEYKNIVVDAL